MSRMLSTVNNPIWLLVLLFDFGQIVTKLELISLCLLKNILKILAKCKDNRSNQAGLYVPFCVIFYVLDTYNLDYSNLPLCHHNFQQIQFESKKKRI